MSDTDPRAIAFVTDEPLVHRPTCLTSPPVLVYSSGRITCAHCGARVPGEVRLRSATAKLSDPPKEES